MNTWEAIAGMIKAEGVEYLFGIGDSSLQLYARKTAGLKTINLRYEGSAPFMAMAYARLSGKPGVCTASAGPGTANLLPGVLEAYTGCSPLVIINGTTSQRLYGMGDFQETDHLALMGPITKWCARIPYTERIPWFIRRAFSIAVNGQPGPVYLEIPSDVSGRSRWDLYDIGNPEYSPSRRIRTTGDPQLIAEALELLIRAKRPVIVCGNGTVLSGASGEVKEFVELLGIPFLTTPGGRGILSEKHPLALGVSGFYRTRVGKEIYSDADLLLTIGTKNESFSTHEWKDFPSRAKHIQIDIEASEIGRNWLPDVGIAGDAKLVLRQLVEALSHEVAAEEDFQGLPRVKELAKAKEAFEKEVEAECMEEETPIPAKRAVYEMSRVFGDNTVLVNENGSQDTWSYCFPYFTVADGSACVPVAEQTCMGMGVVGAVAAKLTRPDKNVVCVTGDGAFQMYMKELPSAAQYKAGCTWLVLNNCAFGWVKDHQMEFAGWNTSSFDVQPDFVKWAHACGCYGRRVEKASELKAVLEEALAANREGRPAVVDVTVGLDLTHFKRAE